jgi:hypothetical protein
MNYIVELVFGDTVVAFDHASLVPPVGGASPPRSPTPALAGDRLIGESHHTSASRPRHTVQLRQCPPQRCPDPRVARPRRARRSRCRASPPLISHAPATMLSTERRAPEGVGVSYSPKPACDAPDPRGIQLPPPPKFCGTRKPPMNATARCATRTSLVLALALDLRAPRHAGCTEAPTRATEQYNVSKSGPALGGYDPVSYFPDGGLSKPLKGEASSATPIAASPTRFASSTTWTSSRPTPMPTSPPTADGAHGQWHRDGSKVRSTRSPTSSPMGASSSSTRTSSRHPAPSSRRTPPPTRRGPTPTGSASRASPDHRGFDTIPLSSPSSTR